MSKISDVINYFKYKVVPVVRKIPQTLDTDIHLKRENTGNVQPAKPIEEPHQVYILETYIEEKVNDKNEIVRIKKTKITKSTGKQEGTKMDGFV